MTCNVVSKMNSKQILSYSKTKQTTKTKTSKLKNIFSPKLKSNIVLNVFKVMHMRKRH